MNNILKTFFVRNNKTAEMVRELHNINSRKFNRRFNGISFCNIDRDVKKHIRKVALNILKIKL